MSGIEESQKFLSIKHDHLINDCKNVRMIQKFQRAEIEKLNESITDIDKDVTYLFDKSEFLEHNGCKDNLEF